MLKKAKFDLSTKRSSRSPNSRRSSRCNGSQPGWHRYLPEVYYRCFSGARRISTQNFFYESIRKHWYMTKWFEARVRLTREVCFWISQKLPAGYLTALMYHHVVVWCIEYIINFLLNARSRRGFGIEVHYFRSNALHALSDKFNRC